MKFKNLFIMTIIFIFTLLLSCGYNTPNYSKPQPGELKGRIVFKSTRDNSHYDIYTINADGTSLKKITNSTIINNNPRWSPDGSSILFEGGHNKQPGIFILKNQELKILATNNDENDGTIFGNPQWHPSAKKVYYEKTSNGLNGDFIELNLDNKTENIIKDIPFQSDPAFAPDGYNIAFIQKNNLQGYNIVFSDLGRKQSKNLTKAEKWIDKEPAWSPDGKRIVFVSTRSGVAQIYNINLEDGSIERVTNDNFININPRWSPDGTKIVYSSYNYGSQFQGAELIVIDLKTKKQWRLIKAVKTQPNGDLSEDLEPDWTN